MALTYAECLTICDQPAANRRMEYPPAPPAPSRARAARWLAAGLGSYALCGGFFSLLGWVADIRRLTDWDNDGISIQPNATLAAMLAGIGLVAMALGYRRAAAFAGLITGLLGGSALIQHLSG